MTVKHQLSAKLAAEIDLPLMAVCGIPLPIQIQPGTTRSPGVRRCSGRFLWMA